MADFEGTCTQTNQQVMNDKEAVTSLKLRGPAVQQLKELAIADERTQSAVMTRLIRSAYTELNGNQIINSLRMEQS